LSLAALGVVTIGALLPATPPAGTPGLEPLPLALYGALAIMVAGYLVLIEIGKRFFYRVARPAVPPTVSPQGRGLKCLYLVTRSLDPTGTGRARWTMRWKPVIKAFAITFGERCPGAETY